MKHFGARLMAALVPLGRRKEDFREAVSTIRTTYRPDLSSQAGVTIDHDTSDLMGITGLSMAARAHAVTDPEEAEKVLRMLPLKYPKDTKLPGPMPTVDQVRIFRLTPMVISILDYTKGFGHTDLVSV